MRLPRVYSALQLFDWADKRFCPSIRELEPIEELKGEEDSICYCGTFKAAEDIGSKKIGLSSRDKILVYMGNGTVSASKTLSVIQAAFAGSKYEVYLATSYLPEETIDNIHIAPRWDFSKLLDEALVYINHGGQNSIVDGLLHGVPQIMVPGKVFERKYNAESVADADAGIVIDFVCNTVVQIMQSFNWSFQAVEEGAEDTSILASVAGPFAVLLVPIVGVAAWQLAAAAITGFIAKENVVGTIATVYAITNLVDPDELELIGEGNAVAVAMGITKVAALAYLMFNLYTPPCFAALGAMNSEMQSKKWLWGAIGLQLGTGYTVGFLVYQIGTLITTGALGAGFVGGLIFEIVFAAILIGIIYHNNKAVAVEYKLA